MARAKRARARIHERTAENDIRYLGPLSCRHLKMLGWLGIILGQAALLIRLLGHLEPALLEKYGVLVDFFTVFSSMSVSLLLLSNFGVILNASEGYGKMLLMYAGLTAAAIGGSLLLYYGYGMGLVAAYADTSRAEARAMASEFVDSQYLAFNLFLDLFLCTLLMYFLNGRPKRVFRGKWIILFRLFAILPLAYEGASIVFKWMATLGRVTVPVWVWPLLTTKPPVTFLVFVFLAFFIKHRERVFLRRGKTHEEYQAFLDTRINSLHFSIFSAITFVVAAVVDFIILVVLTTVLSATPEFLASVTNTAVPEPGAVIETSVEQEPGAATELTATPESIAATELTATPEPIAATELTAMPEPIAAAELTAMPEPNAAAELAVTPEPAQRMTQEQVDALVNQNADLISRNMGFGDAIPLLLLAPFALLFSYNRKSKNKNVDTMIPLAGCGVIAFLYFNAIYLALCYGAKYLNEALPMIMTMTEGM